VERKSSPTVVMGIPKLFRWLTDQYPTINQRISDGLPGKIVDNFYLDMNGIIHMSTHNNNDNLVKLDERAMFQRIFTYTDRLYKIVKPQRVMYLAVDGVAPRAKMNQQRARRFRSAKEQEQLVVELQAQGKKNTLEKEETFDSNCITPGTEFMFKLSVAFQKWIEFKMENDPFWKNQARVVFSGPEVPGEGEHKIMDYIRAARETEEDWRQNMSHVMYGLDADLIMLSLVSHEPDFSLLREKMSVRHGRKGKPKDPLRYTRNDFEFLQINMLREMLHLQFRSLNKQLSFEYNLERIIDDFVFICMFVGNDFLPNMPHLDIKDGALNFMMSVYKNMLPELGGYLTDKSKIHRSRFELFVAEISRREPLYFRQRGRIEEDEGFMDPHGYKDYYYQVKPGFSPEDHQSRQDLVNSYIEGLYWVLQYYHDGCQSWDWYFPHHYAPLASDLRNLAPRKIGFPRGKPVTPMMQLLIVLPAQSGMQLPVVYRNLMVDPDSPLIKFFPDDFGTDANGKQNSWEAVVLIPFIDLPVMIEALCKIDHRLELTPIERRRNVMGKEHDFRLPMHAPQSKEEEEEDPSEELARRERSEERVE